MAKTANEPPKYPEIGARLTQFIKDSGEPNPRQFALKAGLAPQLIHNLAAGYSMPGGETLLALAKAFRKFDATWLLTGTASQLPPPVPSKADPEPLRINREGEEGPGYWQVIASDRLREIEFLKELLRASNGIRPADEETAATASMGKAHASSDAASLYELVDEIHSETQRLVVAGFGTYRRLGMAS